MSRDGLPLSLLGLFLAAAFAVGIGLAADVYPPLRASRLTPVDAIRVAERDRGALPSITMPALSRTNDSGAAAAGVAVLMNR